MTQTSVERELLDLERQYWQAIQDGDVETSLRLSADPCVVTGASGIGSIDRDTLGKMFRHAPWKLESFTLKDGAQVRMVTQDVAVVAYQVHEVLTVEGQRVELDAADASTWVRQDGTWTCALHTEAIAGDPFGRDRRPQVASRKEAAIAFLQLASAGQVQQAFDLFAAPDFRHHNAYFPGDRQSLLDAMAQAHQASPNRSLQVQHAYEDGDTVVTHSLVVRQDPQAPGIAVVHIFRFEGQRVAELWDVGMQLPPDSPNQHGAF